MQTTDPSSEWCVRGGARAYVTTKPVVWSVGGKHSGFSIVIPKGFEFESSVPRYLRWLVDPHDPSLLLSACVHDFLLEIQRYEVLAAAAEWHSAAKKSKVRRFKRVSMFIAVSLYTLRAKHYTQA